MHFLLALDYSVLNFFHTVATQNGIFFFELVTFFGGVLGSLLVTVAALSYFYRYELEQYMLPLVVAMVGNATTIYILKYLIARPRPLAALVLETGFSFPSGHAAAALLLYGFLTCIFLSGRDTEFRKGVCLALVTLVVLAIGISRLYLGVHFLSDVVAGYLIGGLWLSLALREQNFLLQEKFLP